MMRSESIGTLRACIVVCFTIGFATISHADDAVAGKPKLATNPFVEDFNYAWQEIGSTFAYFDARATVWSDIPRLYKRDLQQVKTREQFVGLMEQVLDELYDPHTQLTTNTPKSFRLVPSGTDLWAEWHGGVATITQVRGESDAERVGIKPATTVLSINGVAIAAAVEARLGRSYPHQTSAARDWALRSVLAGQHNVQRVLQVQAGGKQRTVELPARDQYSTRAPDPITHSKLRSGVGYIRLNDSLGNDDTVAAFDRALDELRETRGLIVDLRNTASGGSSSVARGILGRFVSGESPYQKHVLPAEERETGVRRSWFELVSPRGIFTYRQPVVVLVDHWTGSMGEGLAIGFDATKSAKVVGTAMAALVGATYHLELPRSKIGVNVPAERLYHVDGSPREIFKPKFAVDVASTEDNQDPFIAAALSAIGAP